MQIHAASPQRYASPPRFRASEPPSLSGSPDIPRIIDSIFAELERRIEAKKALPPSRSAAGKLLQSTSTIPHRGVGHPMRLILSQGSFDVVVVFPGRGSDFFFIQVTEPTGHPWQAKSDMLRVHRDRHIALVGEEGESSNPSLNLTPEAQEALLVKISESFEQ